MITVKLPDGRRVKINTTDPKAATEAAKKFLAKPAAEPAALEKVGAVGGKLVEGAGEFAKQAIAATPGAIKSAVRTARDVAVETLTPSQSTAEALGVPQLGKQEMLRTISGRETGPVQAAATNLAQDFRERPLETAGSVALGMTPLGRGAGVLAQGAKILGRVALGTGGTIAGAEADKELFKATGGAVGREGEAGDPTVLSALATQVFGEGVGAALRAASPALARAQLSTAKSKLAKLEASAAATESQKAQARKVITTLEGVAQQSKEAVLKQAQKDGSIFEKNGKDMRSAMVALAGDEKKADSLLYADEIYDAGAVADLKRPYFGDYTKQVAKKQRELNQTIETALAPKGVGPSQVQGYTDVLRRKLGAVGENLAKRAARNEQQVFAPVATKTPILGSELTKILDDPSVVAPMAGIGARDTKLAAIRAAIPSGRALGTQDLANFLSTVQSQFVTKDDAKARAIFYDKVFPKLQNLFKDAASRPTGAATRAYSNAFLDYFDSRFKLANLADDTVQKAVEGNPDAVFDVLRSPQALAGFERAVVSTLGLKPSEMQRYVQTLVRQSLKDEQGNYSAAAAARLLDNMDKTLGAKVLGKEFFDKLSAADTVLSGVVAKGVRSRVASLASADLMAAGNRSGQALQNIGIGELTGQPLQAGAGRAQLGRSLLGALRPLNLDNASFEYVASAAQRNLPGPEVYTTLSKLAIEAGRPLIFGYDTFQEKYDAIQKERDKLKVDGQGGPEETAPSMGGRTADELGKLIEQTTAQDDMNQLVQQVSDQDEFDQLVRKAMREEEPKVLRAVGTKEEEGFRTRVYRDTVGKRTIGIGFNMDAPGARDRWVKAGVKTDFNDALNGRKTITKQEAESLYALVKGETELQARKLVRNYATLGKHQQAALKDMVYQLGATGAMAFARTRALIEQGDFSGAARALLDSRNAEQSPARVKRRAYMLQHDVPMAEADAALVKSGTIPSSQSISTPQELSRLMEEVKVAAIPTATPARKKRVRYAEAKAKRGLA